MSGVVVANPSPPELGHAAAALADAGMLRRYHVPLAFTRSRERFVERFPEAISAPLLRELRRRSLPATISPAAVSPTSTITDLARAGASRLPLAAKLGKDAARLHERRFDAAVARHLHPGDQAVLAPLGAASRTTTRAREVGARVCLDAPLAHIRPVRDLLREEARLQPAWACTLQLHDISDESIADFERQLSEADVVLPLCTYARRTYAERGVAEEKLITTPLGVDLDQFLPMDRLDDGVFRVIFVGQITQRKGLSYLVEGFLDAAIPNSELLLVGDVVGSSAPWAATPGVRHLPAMPRSELAAVYATSDVYVLPSLAEGFALTAAEAMACGKPVVLSEHTFADDLISEGVEGFVVPIRDAAAITERLRALASAPDRCRAMGVAARTRAEDFSWAAYGARIVALSRSLGVTAV